MGNVNTSNCFVSGKYLLKIGQTLANDYYKKNKKTKGKLRTESVLSFFLMMCWQSDFHVFQDENRVMKAVKQ